MSSCLMNIFNIRLVSVFKYLAIRTIAVLALAATASVVQAQDAGTLLKSMPAETPKLETDVSIEQRLQGTKSITDVEGMKLEIKEIKITGLTVVPAEEMKPVISQFIGPDKNFQDLLDAAGAIKRELANRGFFLTDAIIPPQKIVGGVVEILVIEGRLGKVKVEYADDVEIYRDLIDGYVAELNSGDIVSARSVERALFLISDLNGLNTRSVFQPGEKMGTADLIIKVSKGKTFHGSLDVDANGSIYTGVIRAGAVANINNLAGLGDMFTVRHLRSIEGGGLSFSRVSYIAAVGPWGSKIGASYSDLKYKLGTPQFEPIRASGGATVASLIGLHPVIRSRNVNLMAMYQYDDRNFNDIKAATNYLEDKNTQVHSVVVSGDLRDTLLGGGINVGNLAFTHGKLSFLQADRRAVDLAGRQAQGGYDKTNFTYSRLQSVSESTAAYFSYSAQRANKNLDGSEKISLGGPYAVRAYPQGEGSGDEGHVGTIEMRYAVPKNEKLAGNMGLSMFYDWAASTINKTPTAADLATPGFNNTYDIAGVGVGLNWDVPENWQLRATTAWRTTKTSTGEHVDRTPRAFIQFNKRF